MAEVVTLAREPAVRPLFRPRVMVHLGAGAQRVCLESVARLGEACGVVAEAVQVVSLDQSALRIANERLRSPELVRRLETEGRVRVRPAEAALPVSVLIVAEQAETPAQSLKACLQTVRQALPESSSATVFLLGARPSTETSGSSEEARGRIAQYITCLKSCDTYDQLSVFFLYPSTASGLVLDDETFRDVCTEIVMLCLVPATADPWWEMASIAAPRKFCTLWFAAGRFPAQAVERCLGARLAAAVLEERVAAGSLPKEAAEVVGRVIGESEVAESFRTSRLVRQLLDGVPAVIAGEGSTLDLSLDTRQFTLDLFQVPPEAWPEAIEDFGNKVAATHLIAWQRRIAANTHQASDSLRKGLPELLRGLVQKTPYTAAGLSAGLDLLEQRCQEGEATALGRGRVADPDAKKRVLQEAIPGVPNPIALFGRIALLLVFEWLAAYQLFSVAAMGHRLRWLAGVAVLTGVQFVLALVWAARAERVRNEVREAYLSAISQAHEDRLAAILSSKMKKLYGDVRALIDETRARMEPFRSRCRDASTRLGEEAQKPWPETELVWSLVTPKDLPDLFSKVCPNAEDLDQTSMAAAAAPGGSSWFGSSTGCSAADIETRVSSVAIAHIRAKNRYRTLMDFLMEQSGGESLSVVKAMLVRASEGRDLLVPFKPCGDPPFGRAFAILPSGIGSTSSLSDGPGRPDWETLPLDCNRIGILRVYDQFSPDLL